MTLRFGWLAIAGSVSFSKRRISQNYDGGDSLEKSKSNNASSCDALDCVALKCVAQKCDMAKCVMARLLSAVRCECPIRATPAATFLAGP
jgi:hypothetical protein